jgi:hypothetical protein
LLALLRQLLLLLLLLLVLLQQLLQTQSSGKPGSKAGHVNTSFLKAAAPA